MDNQKRTLKKKQKPFNHFLKYSSMAMQMGAVIAGFTYLGYYIDEKQNSSTPWFTIGLSMLGVVGGIYVSVKDLIKPSK